MLDLNWIITALVASIIFSATILFLLFRKYRDKIEEYNSAKTAINEAQVGLTRLTEETETTNKALSKSREELSTVEERTRELVELEGRANQIRDLLENGRRRYEELEKHIEEKNTESEEVESELHQLKSDLDLYSRIADFVDFGHFEEPDYLYETSERYNEEIKRIRGQQKQMIKDKLAIELPDDIAIDGSSQKGTQILAGQAKIMLRAFDIECDLLIGKVTPANFTRTLERIEKIAEALEKSAVSLMCGFSTDYIQLKFEECKLYYDYTLKKAHEQEEQRLIREQMREEQQAIREYEKAIADAEKEEQMYEKLLEKARKELSAAQESARAELEAKVLLLEEQLKESQEKEERAKSLAEQTRRGHIYIISNIGSFGEDVYKIGLTRRLDPLDRVNELGDASVPFKFDVHAIIFSDNAPALEAALHRKFDNTRLNAVNRRKEFFRVSLKEIKEAVEELCGTEADFRMTALAEEYYDTLRLQGENVQAA